MSEIGNRLYEDLQKQQFTDCYFQFNENSKKLFLAAHKNVVGLVSPVFNRLLGSEKSKSPIMISDVSFTVFKKLLSSVYGQEVEFSDSEEVCNFFHAAKKYEIPKAVELSRSIILETISEENFDKFYRIGELYDDTEIKTKCFEMLNPIIWDEIQAKKFVLPKAKGGEISNYEIPTGSDLAIALNTFKLHIQQEENMKDRAQKFVGLVQFLRNELDDLVANGFPLKITKKIGTVETTEHDVNINEVAMEIENIQIPETIEQEIPKKQLRKRRNTIDVSDSSQPLKTRLLKINGEFKLVPINGATAEEHEFKIPKPVPKVSSFKNGSNESTAKKPETAAKPASSAPKKDERKVIFYVHRRAFNDGDHIIWSRHNDEMHKYLPVYVDGELQYQPSPIRMKWNLWKVKGDVTGIKIRYIDDTDNSNVAIVKASK